mmetsp:Transcript_337/g.927  ORF Transcript_337/g.927 Transcript_337/m.927 type:complete len:222 (-) Transcript_337:3539-4204(-)
MHLIRSRRFLGSGRVEPPSWSGGAPRTGSTNCLGCGPMEESGGSQHSPRKSSFETVSWSQTSSSTPWRTFMASMKSSSASSCVGSVMATSSLMGCPSGTLRLLLSVVESLRSVSLSTGCDSTQLTNSSFVSAICTLPPRTSISMSMATSRTGKLPSPSTLKISLKRWPSPARTQRSHSILGSPGKGSWILMLARLLLGSPPPVCEGGKKLMLPRPWETCVS